MQKHTHLTTWLARAQLGLAALLGAAVVHAAEAAQPAQPRAVAWDVQYQHIGHWDQQALNKILTTSFPAFSGVPAQYTPAQNGVNLYRVTYRSLIPERGNKSITSSGLVAVPDNYVAGTKLPLVSYQHGTVYGKNEVPSIPQDSPETQLMLAQFGGQGYAVMGADYFGMGTSTEPEGYMVKASHQQATYDMLLAGQAVLKDLQVGTDQLFLSGWSQGGFVTMAMLERLEQEGVPVTAAATASAPLDVYAMVHGFFAVSTPY